MATPVSPSTTQYAFRSLKQLGLISGPPNYSPVAQFQKPENAVKAYKYSADGRLFASCSSIGVQILNAETASIVSEISVKGVVDISLSPKGSHISTWERHVKPADGEPPHKNLRVWDVATGEMITSFSQKAQEGWALQYTEDESRVVRVVTNEVQVYDTTKFNDGQVLDKIRLEGVTSCSISPGVNPSVACFVAEKKGAPASVKIHSLSTLAVPNSSKTFYKADKIQMKWNKSGTNLLFMTQTDVDKTGKSYYGETNLYLMSVSGNFDCRVTLDKEGGIHDFAWSPNDREFAVTYGYMPAKTVIFDQKVNVINDFGTQPRNFLAYNPQGRLLCIAGFGNLAGQVDIWDRKTLKKICTLDAPNTSHCEWSPDGRYLLCATLSPRLRVDNGTRIFHYTGALMHVDSIEELYQASWRPADVELYPFGGPLEPAPTASVSVSSTVVPVKAAAPAGAYRPPHARGTLTPTLFKREDEGGVAYTSSNGTNNFPTNGRTSPNFASRNRRTIPGAAAPADAQAQADDNKQARRKKKEGNKKNKGSEANDSSTAPSGTATPVTELHAPQPVPSPVAAAAALEAAAELSSDDKKRRALMKKLTAIEQLKVKKAFGEKLELTQHKKLDSEAEIRKELEALNVNQ